MIEPCIHVFICLINDSYVRFSFQGASGEADGQAYCESLPNVVTTDYLGSLYDTIDTDKGDRKGTQKYGDSIIVSCKHIGCLMTTRAQPKHTFIEKHRLSFGKALDHQRRELDEAKKLGNS